MSMVEFEYKTTLNDYIDFTLKRFCKGWIIRLYYLIIILYLLAIMILNYVFIPENYKVTNKAFILGISGLLFPVAFFISVTIVLYYTHKKNGKVILFFNDNGYGNKGSYSEIFYHWESVKKIVETEDCIFFDMKNGNYWQIF